MGRLRKGDTVMSSGVVRKVDGYNMLPIKSGGAVEMKFLSPTKTTEADTVPYRSKLLLHTVDWTLHGAKRRRVSY